MIPTKLKLSREKGVFDYKIDCYTPKDYFLILTFKADYSLLKKIWSFRKNWILRQKGIDVRKNKLEDIKEFEVPPNYHNFLKTATQSAFNHTSKIFKKDGIVLLSNQVVRAIYKLTEKKDWIITIRYEGIYTTK